MIDTNERLSWDKLLNARRRKKEHNSETSTPSDDSRTELERDHDRILFSAPVRRLADKTQVFPLDKNDSVRTRLTHSHEVSNLARSIGTALAFKHSIAKEAPDFQRNLPAICAAIGLVHDLGNPPFGHQGEAAIQSWFRDHQDPVLLPLTGESNQLSEDFLKFEGNAQGFRLVTRLQILNDNFGLDLTYATLAAMMKYPTPSNKVSKQAVATKKHGFFASEQSIAENVWERTGLSLGRRHPLACVMEACDDIAYVVLDAEDAVKKGLASVSDLFAFLRHHGNDDQMIERVTKDSEEKHREYRSTAHLSPAELNDVSMQRFRVFAIGALVNSATQTFVRQEEFFLSEPPEKSLIAYSDGEVLRATLKDFAFRHAYKHPSVLRVELQGYNVIRGLMNMFWAAIVNREDPSNLSSARKCPFTRFVYGKISENYRRAFENPAAEIAKIPIRYRECLLLTDMISGMTDSFAVDLHAELLSLIGSFDPDIFLRPTSEQGAKGQDSSK
jgi:dGTPase